MTSLFLYWAVVLFATDPIPALLSQMDKNAAAFKGATANVKRVDHNAAVDIDRPSNGSIAFKKSGPHEIRALFNFTDPSPQQILVSKSTAEIYNPKLQLIQEYDLGKYQAIFQQYVFLGFGGSGEDLKAAYTISSLGDETVNGLNTAHLLLIPKSAEVQKQFKKIELWLTAPAAEPVQLRFSTAAGDTNTVTYANLKMAAPPDSSLKLKTPGGVKREKVR